ncbi:MAG: hypothetical protein WBB74_01435 [Gaiellaceae bacterium]
MKRLTRALLKGALVASMLAAFTGAAAAGGNPNKGSETAPGKSAAAPGQEKKAQQQPAEQSPTPKAAAAKPDEQTATPATAVAKQHDQGKGTKEGKSKSRTHGNSPSSPSSPFKTPSGKARQNVPSGATAGYAAHPESFGGPGSSGTHKYTVCHNGHAITVDVHSWNAHVNGHGDTLLPYGTKGKRACGTTSPATPATAPTSSGGPATTSAAVTVTSNSHPAAKKVRVDVGSKKTIASKRPAKPSGGVPVPVAVVKKGTLPFTGFPIWIAVLIGFGVTAGGFALRRIRATA